MAEDNFPLPQINEAFVGRQIEMDWLERSVFNDDPLGADLPILITGAPGTGKTAFIAAFARKYENKLNILWIDCRTFASRVVELESQIRALSDERRFPDVLVVLDGADEIPVREFGAIRRHLTNHKRIRTIIITSRTDLEMRRKKVHPLGPLSPQDSQSVIEARIKDIDQESLQRILGVAEGSPTALLAVAEMASAMTAEELSRAMEGLLYEVASGTPAPESKLIGVTRPLIISATEEIVKALQKQPMEVYKLHPRQFEELTAELLRDMGHEVKLTKRTRDGGFDIFVYVETNWKPMLCLVDTKLYRRERTIGVEMVRTLYGTLCDYQANSAMLATTTTFSNEARDFEHKHKFQLALQDYTAMATWIKGYGKKRKP